MIRVPIHDAGVRLVELAERARAGETVVIVDADQASIRLVIDPPQADAPPVIAYDATAPARHSGWAAAFWWLMMVAGSVVAGVGGYGAYFNLTERAGSADLLGAGGCGALGLVGAGLALGALWILRHPVDSA